MKPHSFHREFPVSMKKDVLVLGGGPAGCLAALAARRNGADTLLIERDSFLGGMLTGGYVNSMFGFRLQRGYVKYVPTSSWETPRVINGISVEVVKRLQEEGGTLDQGHFGEPSQREIFDPEIMKNVLDKMMEEARIEVLFNTFAFDVVVEDGALKGVVIANKSGGQVIVADVFVDTTADADIAAAAGVPFEKGRQSDGRFHGGSLMMDLGGVDARRYIAYLKSRPERSDDERKELEEEAIRLLGGATQATILTLDGKRGWWSMAGVPKRTPWNEVDAILEKGEALLHLPDLAEEWLAFVKTGSVPPWLGAAKLMYIRAPRATPGLIRHGKIRYDQVRTGVHEAYFDQTNQEEISKAISWMRSMNWIYLKFLKEHIPGFEGAYVLQMQPTVGTRESRRIVGDYTLTEQDCVEGRRFRDVIAKCGHACNVHSLTGDHTEHYFVEPKRPFDIPYRCLVPSRIDNLLVAGRPISVTHLAHGATRDTPVCMSTGEAAGAAAALCSKLGVAPRNLDVRLLQKRLLAQGVLLHLEDDEVESADRLSGRPEVVPVEPR